MLWHISSMETVLDLEPRIPATFYADGTFILRFDPTWKLDDEQFFEFCRLNSDARIERDPKGRIVVMSPSGPSSSSGNLKVASQLDQWAIKDGTGTAFDSSGGFKYPDTAIRAADAAWVLNTRLDALRKDQWKRFLPLAPDFVVELRSMTDTLSALQKKMRDYIKNGVRLGWLIDPPHRQVHIYQPKKKTIILTNPENVSGEPVLHGFVLKLAPIWDAVEGKRPRPRSR